MLLQAIKDFFNSIDAATIEFWHGMADKYGDILTPVMTFVSLLASYGVVCIILSLAFMANKKTRLLGITALVSIALAFIVVNLIVQKVVFRPRPYMASDLVHGYWEKVGAWSESQSSFPSGHVSHFAAFFCVVVLMLKKIKFIIPAVFAILIMACSRNYLMVHYFSDVFAACLFGILAGIVAKFLVGKIYNRGDFCADKNQGFSTGSGNT